MYDRGDGTRFAVRNGQLIPLPREQWQMMRMEDQFNAILYLGPPASMTIEPLSPALCQDSQFIKTRLERLEAHVRIRREPRCARIAGAVGGGRGVDRPTDLRERGRHVGRCDGGSRRRRWAAWCVTCSIAATPST